MSVINQLTQPGGYSPEWSRQNDFGATNGAQVHKPLPHLIPAPRVVHPVATVPHDVAANAAVEDGDEVAAEEVTVGAISDSALTTEAGRASVATETKESDVADGDEG